MTRIQTYMMLGCIATNLVAGNLWLLIGGRTPYYDNPYSSVNFRLMIGASIVPPAAFRAGMRGTFLSAETNRGAGHKL